MLRNKTVLKIFSLFAAIVMWCYVMVEVNPTTTRTFPDIPVKLLHEEELEQEGLAIHNNAGFTVDVVVEGKRATLNELHKSSIKAEASLIGYNAGENEIPVEVDVPEGVTLEEIRTPRIAVQLEKRRSRRQPVQVAFTGQAQEGTPVSLAVSPAEIEVSGAASLVRSANMIRAEVEAEQLTDEESVVEANLTAVDKNGEPVYGVTLSARKADVTAILYEEKTFEQTTKAVELKNPGTGLTAKAASGKIKLTVIGEKAVLEKVKAEDFSLTADLRGLPAGKHRVPVKVRAKADVYQVRAAPEEIEIDITTEQTEE